MGMIPTDLDDALEAVQFSGPLEDGVHEGTVVAAEVREGRAPWVDVELAVQLKTDSGKVAFADIEIAPLTDKDGNRSEGKLKFLKWQLQSLGYTQPLSELESNIDKIFGNRVTFGVTSTEGKNINPNTGKPYINRDVVVKDLVQNVNTAPAEPAVY